MTNENTCLFGLAAEFEDAESLMEAARKTRDAGYNRVRAYTPYYVEGLSEIVDGKRFDFTPWLILAGMVLGAAGAFGLQWYTDVPDFQYPLNVGGRPFNSWQAFMIITFEGGILGGGLAALAGMLAVSGLPLPYHPIFNAPGIELASRSSFFLAIETRDPRFDKDSTWAFLEGLGPTKVSEVPC